MPKAIAPIPLGHSYTCPYCDTTAVIRLYGVQQASSVIISGNDAEEPGFYTWAGGYATSNAELSNWAFAECTNCGHMTVWRKDRMVYPKCTTVDDPNQDMPGEVKDCYLEAAHVLNDSPRSAAALLRLGLQHLLSYLLGEAASGNLYRDITEYSKTAPIQITKALDTIRLAGNESVHPGEIDLNEDPAYASFLFVLMNMICEESISRPKELEEAYQKLPKSKRIISD